MQLAKRGALLHDVGHTRNWEVRPATVEQSDEGRALGHLAIGLQMADQAARASGLPDERRLAVVTQTTLSVDDAAEILAAVKRRFPQVREPKKQDICYATQNRQDAIKEVARRSDVVLVIGSKNSSNSNRLAEVSRELGTPAYLVDDETEVDPAWLEGAEVVGLTSGASAPEWLVERMLGFLASHGATEVEEVRLAQEHLRFSNVRI